MIQWCKWKEKVWRGQLRLPWTCYLLWKICLGSQNCQFHVKGIFSHIRWATGLKKKLCDSNINLSVDFFFSFFFSKGLNSSSRLKEYWPKSQKFCLSSLIKFKPRSDVWDTILLCSFCTQIVFYCIKMSLQPWLPLAPNYSEEVCWTWMG